MTVPPDPAALHCLVPTSRALAATGDGSLSGVRTVIKDCIEIAGHTSSFGHARWRETHGPAADDAPVVARLRAAGAEIIGVTKLDQLAYSIIGNAGEGEPPVNAFDPAGFCGGSSSGSASAVAGGLAELGIGTDTGGSIRVPAAACGLYGLRPTHGRVAATGVIPLAASLDVVGWFAADTELLGRTLTVLGGAAEPRTISRVVVLGGAGAALADRLAATLGASVEHHPLADCVNPEIGDLMARVQGREIWAAHGAWIATHRSALADDVQARLRRAESLAADPDAVVQDDLASRERYRQAVRALVGGDGVLVAPVRPRRGPRRDWSPEDLARFRTETFQLTAPSSLSGLPQLALRHQGLEDPGLSLIGPPNAEETLLELADAVGSI